MRTTLQTMTSFRSGHWPVGAVVAACGDGRVRVSKRATIRAGGLSRAGGKPTT